MNHYYQPDITLINHDHYNIVGLCFSDTIQTSRTRERWAPAPHTGSAEPSWAPGEMPRQADPRGVNRKKMACFTVFPTKNGELTNRSGRLTNRNGELSNRNGELINTNDELTDRNGE